jgi:hypothetical protein
MGYIGLFKSIWRFLMKKQIFTLILAGLMASGSVNASEAATEGILNTVVKSTTAFATDPMTLTAVAGVAVVGGSILIEKTVMPVAGAIKDAWDYFNNDTKSNIRVGVMSFTACAAAFKYFIAPEMVKAAIKAAK